MLNPLVNFASELFPSISPYTKEKVKDAIAQFEHMGGTYKFTLPHPMDFLSQADVISEIPFPRFNKMGQLTTIKADGMLLSNTCDAGRDESLLFAPLIPLSKIPLGQHYDIKRNINYRLLYIHDTDLQDRVVDFGLTSAIPRLLIEKQLSEHKMKKTLSLNAYGYYLFLIKLTVYLLRPEDVEAQDYRK